MNVPRYLARLGLSSAPPTNPEGLRCLQRAHLTSVPFENVDVWRGIPLSLSLPDLYAKVVTRRRGGFCYELNGLFAELLTLLGFHVMRWSARVVDRSSGVLGPPHDHLCLGVQLDRTWLVDVGFGRAFPDPLLVDGAGETKTGEFAVVPDGPHYWVHRFAPERHAGSLYRFDPAPRRLDEFADMCRWHQVSQDSPFTRGLVCTLAHPEGRDTLRDGVFVRERWGVEERRPATDRADLDALLRQEFQID